MKVPEQRSAKWLSGTAWKGLASYVNLGITIAVALLGCGAVGWWLDQHLHTSPIGLLLGLFLGCAVGIWEMWKVIRKLSRKEEPHP